MPACNRITIFGTLGDEGQEIWQTSFAVDNGGAPLTEYEALSDWADAAKVELIDQFAGDALALADLLSGDGAVSQIRADYINAQGEVAQSAVSSGAPVLGSGSTTAPPQCSVVLSLLTGRPGRSYRGRMYWPAIGGSITSSLRLTTATPGEAADATVSLLAAICAVAPGLTEAVPAINSVTANALTAVNEVRVGDVMDTQRRRRNALIEAYTSVPYPAGS